MTVTRHAKAAAQDLADRRRSTQKTEYRRKLLRLQTAFDPPLSSKELAAGLEVDPRDLGRFLSESPRLRHARPEGVVRALVDAVLDGDLLIAVDDAVPGADRSVLICDARDVKLLASSFRVRNLGGGEVPERQSREPENWDDGELWDLFSSGETASGNPASKDPTSKDPAPVAKASPPSPVAVESPAAGASEPWSSPPETRLLIGREVGAMGFGAMRLSTATDGTRPDEDEALGVIRRALDAGMTLIDTADSYALDADDMGHNERLVRKALDGRADRERIVVATKAGLIRPGGKWLPDARPEHLRSACEASLGNLGVEALDLFQLHVVDPKVPLEESVGELARLRDEGKVRHVGLCNVNAEQLDRASAIMPVASVQGGVNFFDKSALEKGLVAHCLEAGAAFIAHGPVGGHRGVARADKDRALGEVARRRGVDPRQVALAWLLHMAPGLIPIPGATREASVDASAAARDLRLDAEDLAILDRGKRAWAVEMRRRLWSLESPTPATATGQEEEKEEEVVLFVGPPAAGKTGRVQPFVDAGRLRLNRDELGGKLSGLVVRMAEAIEEGRRSFVLDNTYPTRESRRPVLELARKHGLRVRCLWIDTPVAESLYNACLRMLDRRGKILSPSEITSLSKEDPNLLPPAAIFSYFRSFEEPTEEEGFAEVERVPFERRIPEDYTTKALLLDYDGTLRRSTGPAPFPLHPDQVEILPGRKELLDRYVADGWKLLGVSNQSAVGKGQLTPELARACFERTNELLGHDIPVVYSPNPTHRAGVWDRKPMPGLGVRLIEEHRLDRRQCLMVGDMDSDELFAEYCGFEYRDQAAFFKD